MVFGEPTGAARCKWASLLMSLPQEGPAAASPGTNAEMGWQPGAGSLPLPASAPITPQPVTSPRSTPPPTSAPPHMPQGEDADQQDFVQVMWESVTTLENNFTLSSKKGGCSGIQHLRLGKCGETDRCRRKALKVLIVVVQWKPPTHVHGQKSDD